jgi:hypothetical protein
MAQEGYPTHEQIRDRDRKQTASRMEEEAALRSVYGTPEEREHERMRVNQEWEKIEHDKAQGMSDSSLWNRHLRRMRRMALSLRDSKKASRRAKHFELAGLSTAAKYFQQRAQMLNRELGKPLDVQKDILVDNLNQFTKYVASLTEKWVARRPGEIWTRPGGQRVMKRPDGTIVPYFGPKKGEEGEEEEEEKRSKGSSMKSPDKETAGRDRKKKSLSDALRLVRGKNGALVSKRFSKSEEVLVRLVRAYLSKQEKKSKYKESGELTKEQKSNPDYVKYNKGIRQSEESAKVYGKAGLREHEKKYTNSSECRFLLASCLLFADIANAMVRKRDLSE